MSYADNGEAAADPGLSVLVIMLRLQGIGADSGQLRHRLGHRAVGVSEMLRCAKELVHRLQKFESYQAA